MKTFSENNLIETIATTFPSFAKKFPPEESVGNYDYMDELSCEVEEEIKKGQRDEQFINNAFDFYNRMAEEGDDEVQNILIISVLEGLSDKEVLTKMAREKLKGFALEMFERVVRFWPNGYMNLKVEEVNEKNLPQIIIEHFPEFAKANPNLESQVCHDYLAEFSVMLRNEMEKEKGGKLLIAKAFELFNVMGEKGDSTIQNALVSVALRGIHDNGDIARRSWQKLEGKAKEYFESISRELNKG